MIREIRGVLSLGAQEGWRVPIIKTEASRGEGVEELSEQIAAHRAHIEEEGTLSERRRRNLMNEVMALAAGRLRRRLEESVPGGPDRQGAARRGRRAPAGSGKRGQEAAGARA